MTRWGSLVVAAALVAAGLAGCVGARDGDAVFLVSPQVAPMDEPVAIRVTGLPGGRRTTVTATAVDVENNTWTASADFTASDDGTVDLSQAPVGGSYQGANPMGLFQFMTTDAPRALGFGPALDHPYDVVLEARIGQKPVARGKATRQTPGALGVTTMDLRVPTDGVYGTLFRPKDTATKKPALLVFGGSEGGLLYPIYAKAALLAAHGYPTLAIAYFKAPGLPDTLTRIPLEYFREALLLLRRQPGVDTAHLLVTGTSFGGEASLLVAATYPDLVDGVISEVPNSYVDAGPGARDHSAWTLNGREVPFSDRFGAPSASVDPRSYIPVRRIRGPILLACGEQDLVWPSCRNVDDVVRRLPGRKDVTVLKYADAGHYVSVFQPYTSVVDSALGSGGTVAGTVAANTDLHVRTLALLAAQ